MNSCRLFVALVALILLTACAGVSKVRYSPLVGGDRAAHSIDQVEAFQTHQPSRHYQEIGVLTYRAGTAEKYVDVVRYMREYAARVGADGIIMMGSNSGPSMAVGNVIGNLTDYRAMAIAYTD